MIETSSFVSFLKIREKMSESKVIAKTKGSEYQLVSINPHGLSYVPLSYIFCNITEQIPLSYRILVDFFL